MLSEGGFGKIGELFFITNKLTLLQQHACEII